jgi:hypothetical protein
MSLSVASGYVILIHVDLYRISPPLAFIPLLTLLFLGAITFNISLFDSKQMHQDFEIVHTGLSHSRSYLSQTPNYHNSDCNDDLLVNNEIDKAKKKGEPNLLLLKSLDTNSDSEIENSPPSLFKYKNSSSSILFSEDSLPSMLSSEDFQQSIFSNEDSPSLFSYEESQQSIPSFEDSLPSIFSSEDSPESLLH